MVRDVECPVVVHTILVVDQDSLLGPRHLGRTEQDVSAEQVVVAEHNFTSEQDSIPAFFFFFRPISNTDMLAGETFTQPLNFRFDEVQLALQYGNA